MPQLELHRCEGSSSCSSLTWSAAALRPWERGATGEPQGLSCHPAEVCCLLEVRGIVKILPKRNIRDLKFSSRCKGRQTEIPEGAKSQLEPQPHRRGTACPHPGPHFVLAGRCRQHGCLSLPAAAVRSRDQRAKLVGALTQISPRNEEGSSHGLDHTQLPQTPMPPCSHTPTFPLGFALAVHDRGAASWLRTGKPCVI